jgi:hypothetical protein
MHAPERTPPDQEDAPRRVADRDEPVRRQVGSWLGLVVALLTLLPLLACSDGRATTPYGLALEGTAELRRGGERLALGAGDHQLAVGDELRVTDGRAVLALPGDGAIELRGGRAPGHNSQLVVGPVPLLLDGHALVVADDGAVRIDSGRTTLSLAGGAARVRASSSVTFSVYSGAGEVEALGRELPDGVPALRQVTVPATGELPRRTVPIVYDEEQPDPWDRRYLGAAIELDPQFRLRSRALERDLARDGSGSLDAEFLARIVPGLASEKAFTDELLDPRRSIAETVIGASIVLSDSRDFADRWRSTFDFRSQGAEWGLVALDQRARRDRFFRVLDTAVTNAFGRGRAADTGGETHVAAPATRERRTSEPGGAETAREALAPGAAPPSPSPQPESQPPPVMNSPELASAPDATVPDAPQESDSLLGSIVETLLGSEEEGSDGVVAPVLRGVVGVLFGPR